MPVRSWLPAGKPKAVVVALHGFNDYSNAFTGAGEYFKGQGIAVVAYDQRGFGMAPHTGIWANEKNLVDDLAQAVRQVKRRWAGVPVYLLGESMGGAVVITAAAEPAFPKVQGIILSAPAVWGAEAMPWFYTGTLWLAAHTVPTYRMTGSDLKILASNNIPMLQRLAADPLVIKKTRVDAIYGVVQLMDDAYAKVPEVKVPVLMLYGGEDQVIPHTAIEYARARFTAPVTYQFYPDGYHMLMRDIQGRRVMGDIEEWIRHPRVGGDPLAKE
jgi:acylglycerol lipase